MARAALTAAFAAVSAAITAIEFYYYFLINLQQLGAAVPGTTTATSTASAAQASASAGGDFQVFLMLLVAAGALHSAVGLIYRHLLQAEAAGAAGNRRLPDGVAFLLLAAAGLLVQGVPGAAAADILCALGAAAFRALPAAATATFFLGMMTLILAAHVRAGGGGAVAGDGQIKEAVPLLTKTAFAAAAGLVLMMAIALCAK
ncbi:unnamed protein product [Urochloa humidicola]